MPRPRVAPSWWSDKSAHPSRRRAAYMRAKKAYPRLELPYVPIEPTPKQEAFLQLDVFAPRVGVLQTFFGGAAGPGKSTALLMRALRYVNVPGYAALLLRRTYTDLALPGALMTMALDWLSGTDAHWSQNDRTWTFPSGARLTFGYLKREDDKERYRSAEFQFIGFDELTQFSQSQYTFLLSRLRRSSSGPLARIPVRAGAASNPGGPGHEWVRLYFVEPGTRQDGAIFMPARLAENPHLDRAQYEATLAHLPAVERARLLEGDWSARDAGVVFNRDWLGLLETAPHEANITASVRAWDLAATEPSAAAPDPDWTVGARCDLLRDGTVVIADIRRVRWSPGKVEALVARTAAEDGPSVDVWVEQEPGASGKLLLATLRRRLGGHVSVAGAPSSESKVARATPLAVAMEEGEVCALPASWRVPLLDELEAFPFGVHDDQVDAVSLGYRKVLASAAPIDVTSHLTPRSELPGGNLLKAKW